MESCVATISLKYPCRENQIRQLFKKYGHSQEMCPSALFVFGDAGKTLILNEFFTYFHIKFVIINCVECYSQKILFEQIINDLRNHKLTRANNYSSYAKFSEDGLKDFLDELRKLDDEQTNQESFIIILKNAERIRDMDHNILPVFLRLQEFTGLNLSTILVSHLSLEKYYPRTGLPEVQTMYFPDYTKKDITTIFKLNFPAVSKDLEEFVAQKYSSDESETQQLLRTLDVAFYENFLNLFLNVFYKLCKDVKELSLIVDECYLQYCEPILVGAVKKDDVTALWRNITKIFQTYLSTLYIRMHEVEDTQNLTPDDLSSLKYQAKKLELPYYAKYLLIAAFLASHNAVKEDKRLFMKNHGKQRKRLQTATAKNKVSEKMATQIGPNSFPIDRLLAIFYAILDEKVGLTCNLMAQISTLIHLKFLIFASGEKNIVEGSSRLQCTVGLDFILHIGQMVDFDVRKYLCDFL